METESPATIATGILRDTAASVTRGGLRARVLSGSVIMLFSSGLVGAINLIYNLAIAHGLGAASFGAANDLGRIGQPEEIAAMAVLLCSPRTGYTVGATIPVDGGTDFF